MSKKICTFCGDIETTHDIETCTELDKWDYVRIAPVAEILLAIKDNALARKIKDHTYVHKVIKEYINKYTAGVIDHLDPHLLEILTTFPFFYMREVREGITVNKVIIPSCKYAKVYDICLIVADESTQEQITTLKAVCNSFYEKLRLDIFISVKKEREIKRGFNSGVLVLA